MGAKTKPVQFDFFTPYLLQNRDDGTKDEEMLDLDEVLSKLDPKVKYSFTMNGDDYVLRQYKKDTKTDIWSLQLLRVRDASIPGVYDEHDSSYEYIDLGDGKRFAESTTVLYDGKNTLFMMQRNRLGASVDRCQDFFAELCQAPIVFKPRMPKDNLRRIRRDCRYKKFLLTADTDGLESADQGSLSQLLRSFSRYNGKVVKVEVSVDRAHDRELNTDAAVELLMEAYHFPGIKKLQVRGAEPDGIQFDTIDLLSDRQHMRLDVAYTSKIPIKHERLESIFMREYCENYRV